MGYSEHEENNAGNNLDKFKGSDEQFEILNKARMESELLYQAVFETSGTAMMIFGEDMLISLVNREFEKLSGYSKEEIENKKKWTEFIAEDDLPQMRQYHINRRIDTLSVPPQYEFKLLTRSGSIRNIHITVNIIRGTKKSVVSFLDITERKITEKALRQAEEKFSNAFHGGPIMMSLTTVEEGRFIDVNNAICEGLGYTREEIIGRTRREINLYPNLEKGQELGRMLMEQGKLENIELSFRTNFGEIRDGRAWSQLFYLDGQPCQITNLVDVTEQNRIQNELAKLERLHLVGEIAVSIGHEIRNPMTSVRGFLQMFIDKYSEDKEILILMIEELDRANSIITEFLSLAKNKVVELIPHNLNSIIKKILPLIQCNATNQEKIIMVENEEIPDLLLDEEEIRQLLLNMINNGLEAMSSGGIITIRTHMEGENVVLSIKDQGNGIHPEVFDRLGTPFLTTKEKGTGLGLAICYGIATRHKAKIDLETSLAGTTFYIRFPIPNQ
jgi:PAS domain S-box-containing protein